MLYISIHSFKFVAAGGYTVALLAVQFWVASDEKKGADKRVAHIVETTVQGSK
jgi:hypothetical protein